VGKRDKNVTSRDKVTKRKALKEPTNLFCRGDCGQKAWEGEKKKERLKDFPTESQHGHEEGSRREENFGLRRKGRDFAGRGCRGGGSRCGDEEDISTKPQRIK